MRRGAAAPRGRPPAASCARFRATQLRLGDVVRLARVDHGDLVACLVPRHREGHRVARSRRCKAATPAVACSAVTGVPRFPPGARHALSEVAAATSVPTSTR